MLVNPKKPHLQGYDPWGRDSLHLEVRGTTPVYSYVTTEIFSSMTKPY